MIPATVHPMVRIVTEKSMLVAITGAQVSRLQAVIKCLYSEGVLPDRITVLSPLGTDRCCATSVLEPRFVPVGRNNVLEIECGNCASATSCTISASKGFENDVIILTDVENLDLEWWSSIIYVGMIQAQVVLPVLLSDLLDDIYMRLGYSSR